MKIVHQVGLRATMTDGTELVADAWLPSDGGRYPVLLQRLPYGRTVASSLVLPHPSWFAQKGYAVVVQDCRGRGDSGGTFQPFVNEGADGAATIEWAAGLPFADGRVATYGFSYQGLNQLYAAARRPKGLCAIAPMMCASDPYEGWTYEGGALRWPFACFWAAQLAGQDAHHPPVPFDTSMVPIIDALGADPPRWFQEWLAHPEDDGYWTARRPDLQAIEVPAFSVLGWFDDFSSGTAQLVGSLGAEAWFGPWSHMPWGTLHGGIEFGVDGSPSGLPAALLAFFDRVFGRNQTASKPPVRYFVINEGWREAEQWPPPAHTRRWSAVSESGSALSRWGDGRLLEIAGEDKRVLGAPVPVVVEPHAPVPGGPIDYQDESAIHDRRDLACFDTEAFGEDLVIAGSPTVRVVTRSDRPRHDLVATLCVVAPDLSARVVSSYAQRMSHGEQVGTERHWEITLRPIAVRVQAGSSIRLTLGGSRFPCYDLNAHTETQSAHSRREEQVVATIEILAADIALPVVDKLPASGSGAD
ncbi:MAG: CocE/NonD family hydrolase [Actinobacteria bacterium]|uniref:Unannotated protein n=1 Tax=freshwater metagenome TaxID=449393 RepID=A0A6J7M5U4_9ZZZZ|nr:CocE/NonD family hydrolase [Actinomycetota bacterium]